MESQRARGWGSRQRWRKGGWPEPRGPSSFQSAQSPNGPLCVSAPGPWVTCLLVNTVHLQSSRPGALGSSVRPQIHVYLPCPLRVCGQTRRDYVAGLPALCLQAAPAEEKRLTALQGAAPRASKVWLQLHRCRGPDSCSLPFNVSVYFHCLHWNMYFNILTRNFIWSIKAQ